MLQILHNNRCGKSRNCLAILESKKLEFEIINYLTTPPTEATLKSVLKKLGIPPIDLVRQKEKLWIDTFKGKTLSEEEIINIMITNPILIERPLLITETSAIIARDEAKIHNFLQ
ncbi:ArsC/Spx/MgsR family protein [Flavobacterium sp. TSSA_36]|uniref:ArsC/Spx/MgsR family protein n=1 Tax=Flavobacterium sp. TSSA_36 TaxID=3447669 RepID=UPI003F34D349